MKKANKFTAIGEAGFLESWGKGDLFTKLSLLVPGLGNLRRGQIVKGLLFLLLAVAYLIYFFGTGLNVLRKLPTLGTKTQERYGKMPKGFLCMSRETTLF